MTEDRDDQRRKIREHEAMVAESNRKAEQSRRDAHEAWLAAARAYWSEEQSREQRDRKLADLFFEWSTSIGLPEQHCQATRQSNLRGVPVGSQRSSYMNKLEERIEESIESIWLLSNQTISLASGERLSSKPGAEHYNGLRAHIRNVQLKYGILFERQDLMVDTDLDERRHKHRTYGAEKDSWKGSNRLSEETASGNSWTGIIITVVLLAAIIVGAYLYYH